MAREPPTAGSAEVCARLDAPANGWAYRAHLDGLRTLAVYLVVLFHAGLGWFEGGFVGVDLFFVLSGYLVTGVVLSDLADSGRIDLARFYARRARRLIPAAGLAVVGTAGGALMVASSLDRSAMVGDATASSLWYANWHFIRESNDYFAATGAESPYLHFWSLSIEEQFYLAFPITMLVLWRIGRQRWIGLFAGTLVLFVVGIGFQIVWAATDANRAYMGTEARMYQILAGVALALAVWRWRLSDRLVRPFRTAAVLAIVSIVAVSTSLVDVSPSRRGIVACGVAALLILALEGSSGGPVVSALGWRPIRWLGQISYGTYLWHWPVVVLTARVLEMSPLATFAVSATVGTALAALSSELVELPVRRASGLDRRPRIAIAGGVAVACVSGLIIAPVLLRSERTPVVQPLAASAVSSTGGPVPDLDWEAIQADQPALPPCERPDGLDCVIMEGSSGTLLLVGDSHARMVIPIFETLARQHDLRLAISYGASCPWQRNVYTGSRGEPRTENCISTRARMLDDLIPALEPDIIVTAGFPRSVGLGGDVFTDRSDWQDLPVDELMRTATASTARSWLAEGRMVVLVEPIPVFPRNQDQLSCLAGATDGSQCVFEGTADSAEESAARLVARGHESALSLDLDGLICPDDPVCVPIVEGEVVRRDSNHITATFADHIASKASLGTIVEHGLADMQSR